MINRVGLKYIWRKLAEKRYFFPFFAGVVFFI